ncbi:MAG: glycoside hydrolase family 28 protein [Saprospiraceae bacterium]
MGNSSFPKLKLLCLTLSIVVAISCNNKSVQVTDQQNPSVSSVEKKQSLYSNLPFQMTMVEDPVFPSLEVNLKNFGAIGDGLFKNTNAFAIAIDELSSKGGGTLVVPRGIWLTGPITLKSNIRIHTEAGALVKFSSDFDDYPLVGTSFEGLETYRCISPVNAEGLENIAFTGEGVFDGSGDAWRPVKISKMAPSNWKKLVNSGGVLSDDKKIWYPSEKSKKGDMPGNFNVPDFTRKQQFEAIKDFLRPVMVSIKNCKNVLLDGPTFQNSPAWNIHPLMSENVIVRNCNIRNPWYAQNGDGLDLESCKNVLIYDNTFDVGDDAICFKSGKNEDGRKRGMATENVIVNNNIVYHGHGGFVIGSEMSGGVKNVKVTNCTFIGTDVGLRFKSTRGRGGVVENIYISDIDMVGIPAEAIRFNMFYGGNSPILEEDQDEEDEARDEKTVPVTVETPSFKNIFMKRIRVADSKTAAMFQGLPEMNLLNVQLEDAIFEAEHGITVIDGDGLQFSNIRLKQKKGSGFTFYNTKNASLDKVVFENEKEAYVKVLGDLSNAIKLSETNADESNVEYGQGAGKQVVNFK